MARLSTAKKRAAELKERVSRMREDKDEIEAALARFGKVSLAISHFPVTIFHFPVTISHFSSLFPTFQVSSRSLSSHYFLIPVTFFSLFTSDLRPHS